MLYQPGLPTAGSHLPCQAPASGQDVLAIVLTSVRCYWPAGNGSGIVWDQQGHVSAAEQHTDCITEPRPSARQQLKDCSIVPTQAAAAWHTLLVVPCADCQQQPILCVGRVLCVMSAMPVYHLQPHRNTANH